MLLTSTAAHEGTGCFQKLVELACELQHGCSKCCTGHFEQLRALLMILLPQVRMQPCKEFEARRVCLLLLIMISWCS